MSLSQKFQGKVLVPWYNSLEWRFVYDILQNTEELKYPNVLEVLKIWKIRVPLLSAGVEGTLIILDALLQDTHHLSDEHIVQLYSLSLMRFLNLTAGNNEKQGTFYQTVTRNELPKWLIDIRHDIAHNNKLPSKSILYLSLEQCLSWIVKKYWSVQEKTISDYFGDQNVQSTKVTELLATYCELSLSTYYKKGLTQHNEALLQKVNYFLTKRHNTESTNMSGLVSILEEMVKQSMEFVKCKKLCNNIISILVSNKALLGHIRRNDKTYSETIPEAFFALWTNLLNLLIQNGLLIELLKRFHENTNNLLISDGIRIASSSWLKKILQSLCKIEINNANKNSALCKTFENVVQLLEQEHCLQLDAYSKSVCDLKPLEDYVLRTPNKYTEEYLIFLLCLNENSDDEVLRLLNLVKGLVSEECNIYAEDLKQVEELVDVDTEMHGNEMHSDISNKDILESKKIISRRKCQKVTNPYIFEGCPLGILPHQDQTRNPCLQIF